jgi:hypothetical protein
MVCLRFWVNSLAARSSGLVCTILRGASGSQTAAGLSNSSRLCNLQICTPTETGRRYGPSWQGRIRVGNGRTGYGQQSYATMLLAISRRELLAGVALIGPLATRARSSSWEYQQFKYDHDERGA